MPTLDEQEKLYALQWSPSKAKGGNLNYMKNVSSPKTLQTAKIKQARQQVNTMEEWFDAGLIKKMTHVEGQAKLPQRYQGADTDQVLISQESSDVTVWPVRIDIGDPEKGKGLRKMRTLYHYMNEKSFEKAVGHFSAGDEDLPLRILRLIRDDVRGRSRWDRTNPKGEIRVSSMEPALFDNKAAVLNEILGMEDPKGKDASGVDLTESADFCLALRIANTCADKAAVEAGRAQLKLNYEELVKQCNEKFGNGDKGRMHSKSSDEDEEEEKVVVKKKSCFARLCGGYDRKKALKRVGKSGEKGAKSMDQRQYAIHLWEKEMAESQRVKKMSDTVKNAREERMDAMQERRRNKESNGKEEPASPNKNKRGSMGVASSPKSATKKGPGGKNPLDIDVSDVTVDVDINQRHTKVQGAGSAMKQKGSLQTKGAKRASMQSAGEEA